MKDGPLPCILDETIKSKIDLLYNAFKESVENIIISKLSPIYKESADELNNVIPTKEYALQPRVEKNEHRPRVVADHNNKLDLAHIPQPKPAPIYHYPTRAKVAKATQSKQLEQLQLDSLALVTHKFITNVVNPPILLKCKQLIKTKDKATWEQGMHNELGCLSPGCKSIKCKNTTFFILKAKVLKGKRIIHARIACAIRSKKAGTHRACSPGGNLISYMGITSTQTVSMTIIKTYWNSVMSAPGTKCTILDIKDFYFN